MEKRLWKVDIIMVNTSLKIVVVDNDLKGLTPKIGSYEGKIFEHVIKEKGINPSDLAGINIESVPLVNEKVKT